MKALICTLVLLLMLSGVALAEQCGSAQSTTTSVTTLNKAAPVVDKAATPLRGVGQTLITIIKVKISFWFGIDLFGDPDLPEGPQLDDGKSTGTGVKDIVPLKDAGGASKDI
jgi:hypothetical protein